MLRKSKLVRFISFVILQLAAMFDCVNMQPNIRIIGSDINTGDLKISGAHSSPTFCSKLYNYYSATKTEWKIACLTLRKKIYKVLYLRFMPLHIVIKDDIFVCIPFLSLSLALFFVLFFAVSMKTNMA